MMLATSNPALVIIDVQKAIDTFSNEQRNNLDAENNIGLLLSVWREKCLPIIHVRHSSKFAASPYSAMSSGFEFKSQVVPKENETVVTKQENCAFIGTELENILHDFGVTELVVSGVLVNNSVDATVRVASGLGFQVRLVHDACASQAIECINGKKFSATDVHWLFLSNLHEEYCRVCSTEQIMEVV